MTAKQYRKWVLTVPIPPAEPPYFPMPGCGGPAGPPPEGTDQRMASFGRRLNELEKILFDGGDEPQADDLEEPPC